MPPNEREPDNPGCLTHNLYSAKLLAALSGPARLLTTSRKDAVGIHSYEAGTWHVATSEVSGRWPVWAPDGGRYALSAVDLVTGTSRIEVRAADHALLATPLSTQPGEPAAIAPRVPHYASWSPDSRLLSYVAPTAHGLALFLCDDGGLGEPREIVVGAPLFSCWDVSARQLLVHADTRLLSVDAATGDVSELDAEAVGFRAPVVGPDAFVAYCRRVGAGVDLLAGPLGGDEMVSLASFPRGVVIRPGPGPTSVSIAVASRPESGVFDRLDVVGWPSGTMRRLWQGPFVAFDWSPAGDRCVLFVPTHMGDGRYQAYVINEIGSVLGATEALVPSEDTRTALSFFDQYLQSHCAWSPDGEVFCLAGRVCRDGVSASLGDPEGDRVFAWAAGPRARLEEVGLGGSVSFPRSGVKGG